MSLPPVATPERLRVLLAVFRIRVVPARDISWIGVEVVMIGTLGTSTMFDMLVTNVELTATVRLQG
jgi:hypothetical protein